jgi:predicted esterase
MNILKTKWGKLAYKSCGTGKEVSLIFHGFGQTHQDMLPFEALLSPNSKFLFIKGLLCIFTPRINPL